MKSTIAGLTAIAVLALMQAINAPGEIIMGATLVTFVAVYWWHPWQRLKRAQGRNRNQRRW